MAITSASKTLLFADLADASPARYPLPAIFSGAHYDHHAMRSDTFEDVGISPSFYPSAERRTGAVQSAGASTLWAGFEPQRARAMTLDDYQAQLQAESERSIGGSIVNHSSFMLSEQHDATGRPLITLSTSGDIILSAPSGSISMFSKTMTREIHGE